MSLLRAESLRTSYDGHRLVLNGIDLQLAPGEVVGIVGPNGAGKTTLLRALAGLLPLQAGAVYYAQTALAALGPRARAKARAYVSQHPASSMPHTVSEIVAMGLAHTDWLFRAPHAPKAVASALREVDCTLAPQRRFDGLSGGEQQQVLIARAILQGAGCLLLDEPMSALDLRHQVAVARALRRHAEASGCVLLSLHDLNLAALLCDRLLLLRAGAPLACGAPVEVLTDALLRQAYDVEVRVALQPNSQKPVVSLDLDAVPNAR